MVECMNLAKQDFLHEYNTDKRYNLKDFPSAKVIARIYEMAVNNAISLDEAIDALEEISSYKTEIRDIITRFTEYKKSRNLMDYDDLLYYTEKVLAENDHLRHRVGLIIRVYTLSDLPTSAIYLALNSVTLIAKPLYWIQIIVPGNLFWTLQTK